MNTKESNVSTIRLVEFGDLSRVPVKVIIKKAKAEKLDDILIIGRTDKGELWAECSLNAGQSLWLIEKLKERILSGTPWNIV